MSREEIVEGLRFAMNKGESLMKAMMSFYSAGYSKTEVEEAARMLSQPSLQSSPPSEPITQTPITIQPSPGTTRQNVSQYGSPENFKDHTSQTLSDIPVPGNPQTVSNYNGKNKHPLSTGMMIFLSLTLFLLLSALVALILFKDVIAKFFGGLL